jgi:hypothetical protein
VLIGIFVVNEAFSSFLRDEQEEGGEDEVADY